MLWLWLMTKTGATFVSIAYCFKEFEEFWDTYEIWGSISHPLSSVPNDLRPFVTQLTRTWTYHAAKIDRIALFGYTNFKIYITSRTIVRMIYFKLFCTAVNTWFELERQLTNQRANFSTPWPWGRARGAFEKGIKGPVDLQNDRKYSSSAHYPVAIILYWPSILAQETSPIVYCPLRLLFHIRAQDTVDAKKSRLASRIDTAKMRAVNISD